MKWRFCCTILAPLAALILCGGICLGISGCIAEPAQVHKDREVSAVETDPWTAPGVVLAEVNGQPITRGEFYRRILEKFGTRTLISGVIKVELFRQEARRLGITVSPAEVEERVGRMVAAEAQKAGGEEQLRAIYLKQGLDLADLRRDYGRDLESHLMAGKVTQALRTVSDEELRGFYQSTFAQKQYRVRYIAYKYDLQGKPAEELVRSKALAREKAERTSQRIRGGADFATIARQESEDLTRESGGDLGYLTESMMPESSLKQAIFRLKPLEVSDPVENDINGAYHVLQVTEVLEHQSYGDCEARLRKELLEREPDQDEIARTLDRLQSKANVRVFDAPRPPTGVAAAAEGVVPPGTSVGDGGRGK